MKYDLICIGMALVDSIIRGFDPKPVSASGYLAESGSLNAGGEAVNEAGFGLFDEQLQDREQNEDTGGDLRPEGQLGFHGLGLGLAQVAVGLAGQGADPGLFRRLKQNRHDHEQG